MIVSASFNFTTSRNQTWEVRSFFVMIVKRISIDIDLSNVNSIIYPNINNDTHFKFK